MGGGRRGRSTLSQGLDREVFQVVRKIIDDRNQYGEKDFRPTFAAIYDEIRRSNSGLNRRPKKLLEDALERVLDTIQQDAADSDSEGPLDRQQAVRAAPQSSNGMNKAIVAQWAAAGTGNSTNGTSTPTGPSTAEVPSKTAQNDPPRKKRKRAPEVDFSPPSHITLRDLGGIGPVIKQLSELLTVPLMCPNLPLESFVRGILIYGPPGCGKTSVAHAIAAAYGVNFINVSAPSIVSGMSGESEKALRDCFENAKEAAPCLLFLDEIDAITPKRESASREMEKRIVAQLATLMDGLDTRRNGGKLVIVLAATNRPDALDPSLRRGGRFDKEINMTVPNQDARENILITLTRNIILAKEVDLKAIAIQTPGYVGADLKDLVSTAQSTSIQRFQDSLTAAAAVSTSEGELTTPNGTVAMEVDPAPQTRAVPIEPELEELESLISYLRAHPQEKRAIEVTQEDFIASLPKVSPSALREGFATVPTVTFSAIGGLDSIIARLRQYIISPILNPRLYHHLGADTTSGTLLFGPPGCGKTLIAKAIANASHANFIAVNGPELLNKYVGESERAVRNVFQRARSSVPVIIFFDELDALVPSRDLKNSEASSRVVNTLLTELDGVTTPREGIYVLAATNRPELIDAAILRPGRIGNIIYIPLPDANGRVEILRAETRNMPGLVFDERMEGLARSLEGFSGADLKDVRTRAAYNTMRRISEMDGGRGSLVEGREADVLFEDFEETVKEVRRSVSDKQVLEYELLRREWETGL